MNWIASVGWSSPTWFSPYWMQGGPIVAPTVIVRGLRVVESGFISVREDSALRIVEDGFLAIFERGSS